MRRRGRRVVLVMNFNGSRAARIREIASSEPDKAEAPTYTTPSGSSNMPLTARVSPCVTQFVPCRIAPPPLQSDANYLGAIRLEKGVERDALLHQGELRMSCLHDG